MFLDDFRKLGCPGRWINGVIVVTLFGCQTATDSAHSKNVEMVSQPQEKSNRCPDLTGVYHAVALSEERDGYLQKPVQGWLTGMLLAGGVGQERRVKRSDGISFLQNFDYVRLKGAHDSSINVSVGYGDEASPRGSKDIPLNNRNRRCRAGAIESSTEFKGGGEGFSSTIHVQLVVRKEHDGSIVATKIESQAKSVASIPTGTEVKTFTYRFKPYIPSDQ
jgi:hypothetical protein